jgi:hypothetical protein
MGFPSTHRRCAGMTAALIVVLIELATLGEGSVYKNGVVKWNFIAVSYDPSWSAIFRAFHKLIDGLIPRRAGADQLASQLVQQQLSATRHDASGGVLIAQLTDEACEPLCRCGLRTHRPSHCRSDFSPLPARAATIAIESPPLSLPNLCEISAANRLTAATSLIRPFACNLNGVKVIVKE